VKQQMERRYNNGRDFGQVYFMLVRRTRNLIQFYATPVRVRPGELKFLFFRRCDGEIVKVKSEKHENLGPAPLATAFVCRRRTCLRICALCGSALRAARYSIAKACLSLQLN